MKAPFPWFGGKSRAAALIWERFGDPVNYVEPFAGSLAVLLNRPTAPRTETVNDLDCYLANFWRALQANPEAVAHYADWPVNEADLHARHAWLVATGQERIASLRSDPDFYDAKVAGWWVWGLCQWIGTGWCGGATAAKLPHLGDNGRGIHRPSQQLPFLNRPGAGIHRLSHQLPALSRPGRGIHANERSADLHSYLQALSDRLRRARVACGEWDRILGESVTIKLGMTAVLLDPPYGDFEHYYSEANRVAQDAAAWALANGNNPLLRIALCGYAGEHTMPDSWECVAWKAGGGYSNQGGASQNAHRERIWFSPACLRPAVAPRMLNMFDLEAA